MDTRMSAAEREAFLAEAHVGVLALTRESDAPLAVPIWYDYVPGETVWLITQRDSRKGRLLGQGTRVALCVQEEQAPYRYVSVDGPVIELRDAELERDLRPMARRYLGERNGDRYADASGVEASMRVTLRPQRWLSVDYRKSR